MRNFCMARIRDFRFLPPNIIHKFCIIFMKIYFITFGSDGYEPAVARLCKQAESFNIFDKIYGLGTRNIMGTDFWNKHKTFILSRPRGFGYWIWKSYIINDLLQTIEPGDIILYLDSGCELYEPQKQKLIDQIETLSKSDTDYFGTCCASNDFNGTKGDLLQLFEVNMDELDDTKKCLLPHVQTCALLMKKTDNMCKMVNMWHNICCEYRYIDDSRSFTKNPRHFIEHRHDQSVLNMVLKNYGQLNYTLCATSEGINYELPIWCSRNKTGISLI